MPMEAGDWFALADIIDISKTEAAFDGERFEDVLYKNVLAHAARKSAEESAEGVE